jgi:carboxylate-amine ligase
MPKAHAPELDTAALVLERGFGTSPSLSLGAEEELLLVERDTHRLVHEAPAVVEAMALPSNLVHTELYAACLELATPVCGDAPEAAATLTRLRAGARAAGATAIGAGLHPSAQPGDAEMLAGDARYRYIGRLLGSAAMRTPECALHVHVGLPDAETAVRVLNGLRPHLALLTALAANSPFLDGGDSGFASARGVQMRRYPRFEVPRAFAGFDDYVGALEAVMAAAAVDDGTLIWWQLRLHPRLGTVEVRVMDSQSSLSTVAALAALIHGLAARAVEAASPPDAPAETVGESCYQAMRFGLDALLWDGERARPARELIREAVEHARPYAAELGSDAPLDEVERVLVDGNGADRQRAAFQDDGMAGLFRFLVDDGTLSSPAG